MDNLTKEQRVECMTNIKSKDTKLELLVRKALFKEGIRYRLHNNKLPGRPDITISKQKRVIFINGCFWHQHNKCKYSVLPKSNKEYWRPKLERNMQKQKRDIKQLRKDGWNVSVLWECELKNKKLANDKVTQILQ